MNSYAWTYLLVSDGVAILGQAGRGMAFRNPDQTRGEWATLMDGARQVHAAALEQRERSDDRLLLVVWSPMRSLSTWQWLDRGGLLSYVASEEGDVDRGHEVEAIELFPTAVREAFSVRPQS